MEEHIDFNYDLLETGDIILFSGRDSIISSIVEGFTNSKWSHVGMVLRSPTYINEKLTGLYLWESGAENYPDSEDNKKKYGVQITDLVKMIGQYEGIVVWRKLQWKPEDLEVKMRIIHDTIHDRPYDLDIFDFIFTKLGIDMSPDKYNSMILNWFGYNPRKLDKLYCSSLVAYIYTELGLLPKKTNWTNIFPKYFSSENNTLQLIKATLDKEIIIKNN
tara:strand:+ start:64 stop:717 length:654 start_codon:yes stop_codon:yes gene_type:complete